VGKNSMGRADSLVTGTALALVAVSVAALAALTLL
jgi:hypothetical protein